MTRQTANDSDETDSPKPRPARRRLPRQGTAIAAVGAMGSVSTGGVVAAVGEVFQREVRR